MCWCTDMILVTGHLAPIGYVAVISYLVDKVLLWAWDSNPSVGVWLNLIWEDPSFFFFNIYIYCFLLCFNNRIATDEAGSWLKAAVSELGAGSGAQLLGGWGQERRWCQHLGRVPVWCHSCCTPASQHAGSSLPRGCKKVKKWRGRAEDAGKIALKKEKEREQMQESIKEQPLCCVDRVQYQLDYLKPSYSFRNQFSILSPLCLVGGTSGLVSSAFICIPEWWKRQQPAHLTWGAPLCSWAAGQRVSRVWISSPCAFICLSDPLNKTSIRKAVRWCEGLLNVTVMSAALGAEQPPKSRKLCNIYRNRIC